MCLFNRSAHSAGPFLVPRDSYICEQLLGRWLLGDKLLSSTYLIEKAVPGGWNHVTSHILGYFGGAWGVSGTFRGPTGRPRGGSGPLGGCLGKLQGPSGSLRGVSGRARDALGLLWDTLRGALGTLWASTGARIGAQRCSKGCSKTSLEGSGQPFAAPWRSMKSLKKRWFLFHFHLWAAAGGGSRHT